VTDAQKLRNILGALPRFAIGAWFGERLEGETSVRILHENTWTNRGCSCFLLVKRRSAVRRRCARIDGVPGFSRSCDCFPRAQGDQAAGVITNGNVVDVVDGYLR